MGSIREQLEVDDKALKNLGERRILLLLDELNSPQRGVLVSPASEITSVLVNELLTLGAGLLFVAISPARARAFMLEPMSRPRTDPSCSASQQTESFSLYQSVEARSGVTTGISAADRAHTIAALAENDPTPRSLVKPGHVFPVQVREGGLLVRHALPEGALDAVRLAECGDAAAFIDILDATGEYLDAKGCRELAAKHGIPVMTLGALTLLCLQHEQLVERVAEARLPTQLAGEVRIIAYRSQPDGGEHLALVKGAIDPSSPTLTRVQAENTVGDLFGGSLSTRRQIQRSLELINQHGSGVLVYLRRSYCAPFGSQEIGRQTDRSRNSVSMMRDYGLGAQILRDLGVHKVELLTGSQVNFIGLRSFGMEIVAQRTLTP